MPLYVVRADNPPAGADFELVVPGQFLYDVTGITAQLATGSTATVAHDSSGNGNDAQYVSPAPPVFVPGLVAGDDACQFGTTYNQFLTGIDCFPTPFSDAAGFALGVWVQTPLPDDQIYFTFRLHDQAGPNYVQIQWANLGSVTLTINNGFVGWQTFTSQPPHDGLPHFITVSYDPAVQKPEFTIDGVVQAIFPNTAHALNAATIDRLSCGLGYVFFNPITSSTVDELAVYNHPVPAATFAAQYAAAFTSFAAWTAAVLAATPLAFYHLDDAIPSTGRTPSLSVTDGTTEVERLCSGFPAVTTPGPYLYSWQTKLSADTQTPDGKLTAVALPRLLLPAGYTVGTRTLDLQPGDQWSQVTLWWDSTVNDSQAGVNPYVFPPGAHLIYQQEPAIP